MHHVCKLVQERIFSVKHIYSVIQGTLHLSFFICLHCLYVALSSSLLILHKI